MQIYQRPSEEWLREQYINQHRSSIDIAKDFGCGNHVVLRWLKIFDIGNLKPIYKQSLEQKQHKKQYDKEYAQRPGIQERWNEDYKENGKLANVKGIRARNRQNRTLIAKSTVITHYGGKCNCCGETELTFLTIDHIDNNGGQHRKQLGISAGYEFYCWLIKNNFPEGYQVLCWNCNEAKQINGGICPHKEILKLHSNLKIDAYSRISEQCQCCGIKNFIFFTFDHINNDGKYWKTIHHGGEQLYQWILNRTGPKPKFTDYNPREILQLLCWNCNEGKRLNGGICPHQSLNSNRFMFPLV